MAVPIAKNQFTTGEVSPAMLGRQDVERYHSAGSTVRNFFVSYTGPIYSRAGTALVGYSKQTGRLFPPRLIPFQFSLSQALVLEFGNGYMRAISEGAFVTEAPLTITGATASNPVLLSIADVSGVGSATPNVFGVVASYNTGDSVTLEGGVFVAPGVLDVTATQLSRAYPNVPGTAYVPADTVTFAGGTFSSTSHGSVSATQLGAAPTIAAGGSGGTNGTQIVTGTTGTGTKFQVSVTVAGGAITAILGIVKRGVYTVNPTSLTNEPVTGAGLTGAQLSVQMGVQAITVATPGSYTVNPTGGTLTQSATSGAGTGLVAIGTFAPLTLSVTTPGQYTTFPLNPVSQASTSGSGVGATFDLSSTPVSPPLNVGDWAFVSGMTGMTQLNGETFVVGSISGNSYALYDVFGASVDATGFPAYTGGGTVARIFTLETPYLEADLPWLKYVQSADTMSLCLVNQTTGTEYAAQDLTRISDVDWVFSPVVPDSSVLPPASVSGVATAAGTVNYEYLVTSIDPINGTESIQSPIASVPNAVDIASTAGSITVSWSAVAGVGEYFVYKALPGYGAPIPTGAQFAFAGFSYGNSFIDSNIVPDFSQSPPTHRNPFARGVVTGGTAVSGGTGYTTITLTPTSGTGTGGVLTGVLENGSLIGVIVDDQGENYEAGDTITVDGDGVGAAATLQVGPQSGTYPGLPAYFQERRGYAYSLDNPDTYWFSQPGAFTNFDVRNPTIASDAITGSPWAVQVNGVQWMIQTSGGLLVMTGQRAWMLVGSGSFATNVQPISPSNQNDVPQAFTGCSPLVPPVLINYDVIYVDQNGVYYYDLPYQLYALSAPKDLTDISSHLFTGFSVVGNAYCEKPYRVLWSVRSDGALLSLTYYETQKVEGWARHDTQGAFVGACSIVEPPVNAAYFATQRFPFQGAPYLIERMDNRIWQAAEDVWAVDCGLSFPQPEPEGSLFIDSPTGLGSLTGATQIVGGSGYSSGAHGVVVDQALDRLGNPLGSGAVPALTFAGGALTEVSFSPEGSGYEQPLLTIVDPAGSAGGSGATARPILNNACTLSSPSSVFSPGDVGSIVRAAGGIAEIVTYLAPTSVGANILSPFTQTQVASGVPFVPTVLPGSWTMTAPVTVVSGLRHLAGQSVTGLADGNVITPRVVSSSGTITLDVPASAIVVGLGFQCQFQDVPIDTGSPTIQAQRKKLTATSLRLEASRGVKVGSNQRDGSAQSPPQLAVVWSNLDSLPDDPPDAQNFPPKPYNALCTPLRTGDVRTALKSGTVTAGQLCIQQDLPLPANIVAIYSELLPGDATQVQAPAKQGKGR